jgi:molybdopterin molybdotransferase
MTDALREIDVCAKDQSLVTLDEACRRAALYVTPLDRREGIPVPDGLGRILAERINARMALPPFDQSAMDGYAFAASSIRGIATELQIVSRITAGSRPPPLIAGEAARVFTGAPIPDGADTVVMQEHVLRHGFRVTVDGPVRPGSNLRRRGEDIEEGEPLLEAGQRLDARHLAVLSAERFSQVQVLSRPRIAIVSTGDELRQPGEVLGEASIFDSNRPMLLALARQAGFDAIDGGSVADDTRAIGHRLLALADIADLVATSGGASVGEADHSAAALAESGASFETLMMALKPGKPAVVGRIGRAAYLGLPGNPVSALVSWLTVGNAMLARLCGMKPGHRAGSPMTIVSTFERRPGRTEFVPARLLASGAGPRLEILGRGGSARLKPLIQADGLAEIAASAGSLNPGDSVLFHPFQSGLLT